MSSSNSSRVIPQSAPVPEFLRIHPQVFVRDIGRSVAFYRDHLGFSVGYTYGEPPFYALVTRGPIGLNLRHTDNAVIDPAERDRDDLLSAMIVVSELKALFLDYKEQGVPFHQPLREQPWGHDFIVRDPDGNLIGFGGPGSEAT